MTPISQKPQGLRLSRAKGFNLQAWSRELNGLPAVNASRPSPLGNPFIVGKHGTRAECVDLHRNLLAGYLCISLDSECIEAQLAHLSYVKENRKRLKGHNVACWCSLDGPCHRNTLLEVFNRGRS
jgi:hypothetical protein